MEFEYVALDRIYMLVSHKKKIIIKKGAKFQSLVFQKDGFAVEPKVTTTEIVAIVFRFEFQFGSGDTSLTKRNLKHELRSTNSNTHTHTHSE